MLGPQGPGCVLGATLRVICCPVIGMAGEAGDHMFLVAIEKLFLARVQSSIPVTSILHCRHYHLII